MKAGSGKLEQLLGIEHPVVQAPMAGATTPELVAAVIEAGGLGSLGAAVLPLDELSRQVAAVRDQAAGPLNLNFFCHEPPDPEQLDPSAREQVRGLYHELGLGEPPQPGVPPLGFDDERLDAVVELRPEVVSFHFGLPGEAAMRRLRDTGCRVISSATTVEEAEALVARGADAVIAQGAEAGGHRGSFLAAGDQGPVGTLALVPQVVDAVEVPVIAAGGIGDGRGLAAALALGAAGAQIGTAFLACPEAATHPLHREELKSARAEDAQITRAFSGRPARALRNRATGELPARPLPFPAQLSLTAPLGAAAAERGSADFLALWAGQAAPLARPMPADELIATIVADADRALAGLGDPAGA